VAWEGEVFELRDDEENEEDEEDEEGVRSFRISWMRIETMESRNKGQNTDSTISDRRYFTYLPSLLRYLRFPTR